MTFDSIWLRLCEKSHLLVDGESIVEFRSKNLKILLRQVYEQGQNSIPKKSDPVPSTNNDWLDSIFGNLGKKK